MNPEATVPGVDAAVGLTNSPIFGHVLTVNGRPAKRDKGAYLLPGFGGQTLRATLKGKFLAEHPLLIIGDHEYTTGPLTPPFLVIIAFLPALFALGLSPVALVLAVLGVLFNLWILRAPRAEAWKVGVILVGFVIMIVLATVWAFVSVWLMNLVSR